MARHLDHCFVVGGFTKLGDLLTNSSLLSQGDSPVLTMATNFELLGRTRRSLFWFHFAFIIYQPPTDVGSHITTTFGFVSHKLPWLTISLLWSWCGNLSPSRKDFTTSFLPHQHSIIYQPPTLNFFLAMRLKAPLEAST